MSTAINYQQFEEIEKQKATIYDFSGDSTGILSFQRTLNSQREHVGHWLNFDNNLPRAIRTAALAASNSCK